MRENKKRKNNHTKSGINSWPEEDRPREKLLKKGPSALTNTELLAILISKGTKGHSAVDIARDILKKFKTFRNISHLDKREWDQFKGIGKAKKAHILAALEIGRRFRENEAIQENKKLKSSKDVADMLMPEMRDLKIELFKVVYLNNDNRIIDIVNMARGSVNEAYPIIREIIHKALQKYATSIICVHNHPSGNIKPSKEDLEFVAKLTKACKYVDLNLLDNIIIGNNKSVSISDK